MGDMGIVCINLNLYSNLDADFRYGKMRSECVYDIIVFVFEFNIEGWSFGINSLRE